MELNLEMPLEDIWEVIEDDYKCFLDLSNESKEAKDCLSMARYYIKIKKDMQTLIDKMCLIMGEGLEEYMKNNPGIYEPEEM